MTDSSSTMMNAEHFSLDTGGRRFRMLLAATFVGLAGLFILTAPVVHIEANDAYLFAHDIEKASFSEAINPRHVIFAPINRALFAGARAIGIADRVVGVVSVTNALVAAGAVILQIQILRRRLDVPLRSSLLGGILLAVTYGFWRFSAEIETYMWGVLTALALVYVITSNDGSTRSPVIAGVLAAVAFLAHGLNGLLVFPVVPVFLLASRRLRDLVIYGAVASVLLVATTFLFYLLASPSDSDYLEFYASEGSVSLSMSRVAQATIGSGQALLSSQFLFAYDEFSERVERSFPSNSVSDQAYLGEKLGPVTTGMMSMTFLVAAALLGVAAYRVVRGLRNSIKRPIVGLLASWLLIHAVFLLIVGSGSAGPQLWVLVLAPASTLAVIGLDAHAPTQRAGPPRLLLALIVALLVHNAVGMTLWLRPELDRHRERSAWLVENTTADDAILIAETESLYQYLRYHTDAEAFNLIGKQDPFQILALAKSVPGSVYAMGDAFEPPTFLAHARPELYRRLLSFGDSVRGEFTRVIDDEFTDVYVLSDPQ